jgi:hypothetical protein
MEKHLITVQYTLVLTETIEIEADSCDEANEKAIYEMNKQVGDGVSHPARRERLKNRIQTEGRLTSEILIGA